MTNYILNIIQGGTLALVFCDEITEGVVKECMECSSVVTLQNHASEEKSKIEGEYIAARIYRLLDAVI
jgi:hypothetical protein